MLQNHPAVPRRRPSFGALPVACLAVLLGGCAANAIKLAPDSPAEPWEPSASTESTLLPVSVEVTSDKTDAPRDFSVPRNPEVAGFSPPPSVEPGHAYELAELIDIAAQNNPLTQQAWQQARQAALAVGMAEAAFLPTISANVLGGAQEVRTPLPDVFGDKDYLETTETGVVSALVLEWLVFDFGQREALLEAAKHHSFAANISFNAVHQELIYDVTRTYYTYGAAKRHVQVAQESLENSRRILDAANERRATGIGTSIEVAQARQQVAQSKLRLVEAQGDVRDTYQSLLATMGISPMTELEVSDATDRDLPGPNEVPTEKLVEFALPQRPDVLAAYSELKASQAQIEAAEAKFLPNVYLGATATRQHTSLGVGKVSTLDQQVGSTGVFLGVTVPLYDAGMRAAQLEEARSISASAEAEFKKTKQEAVREIVVSTNTLRSALESFEAATELANTTDLTYDAALDAYRNGVGTITAVTEANSTLLDARESQADAHAASLVAAATFAFSLGSMTSDDVNLDSLE